MDDSNVFEAGTVTPMFQVEFDTVLGGGHRLSDDAITALIETLVDDLDELGLEPSVQTERRGDELGVSLTLMTSDEQAVDALEHGITALKAAFHGAGIGTPGLVVPRDLRSRVVSIGPAKV